MNGASQTLSFDSLLFHLSPSSAVLTFFIVSTGTLSLTSCDVGSDTLTKLNDHTISSVHVSNDPSLGTVIHLSLGTTFSSTIDTLFDEIASNGTGSLIFVEASDLDSTSKQAPFALLKSSIEPPQGRLFTEAEKDEFVGQVGTDSPESMFSFGFPHTIQETTLSVHGEGEDHANCGLTQLPCETLDKGFSSLKRTESTLLVGGSTSLAKPHSTSFTEQTIKSKSGIATITTASSAATASTLNDALFNIVGSMTIKSSIKTRISTSSSTGLFSIDLSGTHSLSVISTSLVSYTASAAPLVSLTLSNNTELTDWKFNLSGLSFPAASSNVVPRGALIFVSGTSFATQIVHSRFPSVDSSTDPEAFRGMILRLKCPHRCLSI
ncbi:hypothetical protein BLNAU_11675 [Blattamonas nauphoetae]|uniref:Uncharacterized protein n=1 Tax=Blattamonas nauphoetae TaxID=2049346 RepID=A0ABQ9XNQ9_9EUKA|nr:hypothetical protein BLNAU_11675 [Blattamonas nauphoetae]